MKLADIRNPAIGLCADPRTTAISRAQRSAQGLSISARPGHAGGAAIFHIGIAGLKSIALFWTWSKTELKS
jgi:hypothetical protein